MSHKIPSRKGVSMGMKSCVFRKSLAMIITALLAGAIALMLSLSLSTSQAWAGGQPDTPRLDDLGKAYTVSYKGKGIDSGYRQYQSLKYPNKSITKASSSNKKVATVRANHYGDHYTLGVTIKKTGTTKITYYFGGQKKTVKYTVKKYTNPVKTFKVGSKNYASLFAPKALKWGSEYAMGLSTAKSFSGKVNIKAAKGWKINKIWYYKNNKKLTFIKNGKKVSKTIYVYVSLKRGKQKEILYLYAGGKNGLRVG